MSKYGIGSLKVSEIGEKFKYLSEYGENTDVKKKKGFTHPACLTLLSLKSKCGHSSSRWGLNLSDYGKFLC